MNTANIQTFAAKEEHPAFSRISAVSSTCGRILIVCDRDPADNPVQAALNMIENQSFAIDHVATATEALCRLGAGEYDIAFIDGTVAGVDGAGIIRQAGGRLSPTPMVYVDRDVVPGAGEIDIPGGATDMILEQEISPLLLQRIIRYARSSHAAARRLIVDENRYSEIAQGASEASSQKSEFLALMSHEFRTPLNAILGFSEAIGLEVFGKLSGEGARRYKEYVQHIHSSGTHLLGLINDLLDLSKIEAGRQEIDPENTRLGDVLEEVIRMVTPQARAGGVALAADADGVSSIDIYADRRLVTQAVLNVVANAVKCSPVGETVSLRARREGRNVVITVTDRGCGIPKSELARVLEPFHQAETMETRPGRGTGLGLPLSQSIMSLHQGGLEIDSEEGRGTTVALWLPRDVGGAASEAA
ncbi:MAG: ATP-binding protein [Alphaproteobacteria bacterium]